METLPNLGTEAGILAVVIILVQLAKPWLPSDNVTRLAGVGLGIVLSLIYTAVAGASSAVPLIPMDWLVSALKGLMAGFSAVGVYNTLNPISGNLLTSRSGRQ